VTVTSLTYKEEKASQLLNEF